MRSAGGRATGEARVPWLVRIRARRTGCRCAGRIAPDGESGGRGGCRAGVEKARRGTNGCRVRPRLPSVLTREEVTRVLAQMRGPTRLMASLLYGSGLRLMECCRLRVKDLDLTLGEITVREGKGRKDRVTMLPRSLIAPLAEQMRRGQARHVADVEAGGGWVELPGALRAKLGDGAARGWPWQWVFPAARTYVSRDGGERRRHHLQRVCCSGPSPRPRGRVRHQDGAAALGAP